MRKSKETLGIGSVLVALAALCWGVSGGIGGILLSNGWDAYVVSLYRGAIGLLFVLIWLFFSSHDGGLSKRRLWFWAMIAGLGVAGNFAFYFVSIEKGSVAVAATLMYCAPVFVYLISFLFKLERPTPLKWGGIVVVIIGIVLLTGIYDINEESISFIGIGSGLLAGLSYAIFIFGFKYASEYGNPQSILVIAFTVLIAILIWPSDGSQVVEVLGSNDWVIFIALGVVGAGLSFILYVSGLNNTAPTVASIVAMIEPVTASLFSVLFLNEVLESLQVVGMGLILITVTTLSVFSNN